MGNELILVVDDNEAGRYAKCRMLRQADFQVKEAGSGGEALQIIAAERPDLVCLDVRLPDINGFEVCRRIKTDPLLRSMVTMLFVQAYGGDALHAVGATDARLAIQMNESTVDKRIALSARRSS